MCLERQCIFETESQDIRILSFWESLEISEGSFFDGEPQISGSSTTPERKILPNTQNTVDGKRYFIRDIISPSGVNKTD